jgi:catechol 2,3-dioxygenase-like lactoylglutathione lyase family enzyme
MAKFAHVTIYAADPAASAEQYEAAFGFKTQYKHENLFYGLVCSSLG